jgi:hypothetical protein
VLRVGAVVAGVLGVAAAIAGGAGLIAKPDAIVWASAPLDRPVVVIPPQVLAMDGVLEIVVEGEPYTEIRTALPADAYAWLRGESSIVVRGVSSWTEVTLVRPQIYTYDGNEMTGDIWRSNIVRYGKMHIRPDDVPPGLAVVVVTRSHTALDKVSIQLSRDPGYEWAWPTISAGALLVAVSISLFAIAWLAPAPTPALPQEAEVVAPTPARKPKGPKSKDPADVELESAEPESKRRASGPPALEGDAREGSAPEGNAPEGNAPDASSPEAPAPDARVSRRARRAARKEAET